MNDLKPFKHGEEGTHSTCNTRLGKERGKARCCWCVPHEGCDFLKNMGIDISIGKSPQEKIINTIHNQIVDKEKLSVMSPFHPQNQPQWWKEFDKTKFVKSGGGCFECCDYEDMYNDLKLFINQLLKKEEEKWRTIIKSNWGDPPMGVSQWRNHGKKYGYDKFFERQFKEKIIKWAKNRKINEKCIPKIIKCEEGWNRAFELLLDYLKND